MGVHHSVGKELISYDKHVACTLSQGSKLGHDA